MDVRTHALGHLNAHTFVFPPFETGVFSAPCTCVRTGVRAGAHLQQYACMCSSCRQDKCMRARAAVGRQNNCMRVVHCKDKNRCVDSVLGTLPNKWGLMLSGISAKWGFLLIAGVLLDRVLCSAGFLLDRAAVLWRGGSRHAKAHGGRGLLLGGDGGRLGRPFQEGPPLRLHPHHHLRPRPGAPPPTPPHLPPPPLLPRPHHHL